MNHSLNEKAAIASVPRVGAVLCALSAALVAATPTSAQEEGCGFFEGKTVELIVPFDPGGGYDVYGRLIAKHIAPELGAANVIVRNQPGAGGLLATNQTWAGEPDGLTIQLMATSGLLAAEMGGAPGVQFESGRFSWIGRLSGEPNVVSLSPGGDVSSVEDLLALSEEREVRIGSTGVGNVHYIEGQILTIAFDLDTNLVVGFSGTSEVFASMARGELDLTTSSASAASAAEAAGSAEVAWLFAAAPDPNYPELEPIGAAASEAGAALIRAHADLVAGGRSLAAPPGLSDDRLECLRQAFDEAVGSEALLQEADALSRPISALSGADLAATIENLVAEAPEAYVELLRQSYDN